MHEPHPPAAPVDPAEGEAFLVWVTGQDRPGIAAEVLQTVGRSGAWVQDIEQLTLRGRIILGLALAVPRHSDLLKDLLYLGWEHDLHVDFEAVSRESSPREAGHVVTLLGHRLSAAALESAARAVTESGANIDRIVRLAKYPVFSYELIVRGGDADKLRANLMVAAGENPELDVAVQREGLRRRAKRLVVLDVDSTLIENEVIDLLADEAGKGPECAAITERAMRGELDFGEALTARVALFAGSPVAIIARAQARLTLTAGARTFVRTLKRLGFRLAIVSGGFTAFTDSLRDELGVDHAYANELEIVDGVITGRLVGPIVDRERKAELLHEIADAEGIDIDQTVAVGDGANDLDMLNEAGLGIAFNAKKVVQEAVDTSLSVPYLDAVLFVLGVSRDHIEEADTEAFGAPIDYPSV